MKIFSSSSCSKGCSFVNSGRMWTKDVLFWSWSLNVWLQILVIQLICIKDTKKQKCLFHIKFVHLRPIKIRPSKSQNNIKILNNSTLIWDMVCSSTALIDGVTCFWKGTFFLQRPILYCYRFWLHLVSLIR